LIASAALQAQGDHIGIEDGLAGPSGFVVPAGLGAADIPVVDRAASDRLADSFHSVAMRLHAAPTRRGDAAVLHVFAADLRGLDDARSVSDLRLASNLFAADGNPKAACAAMETAGRVAVRFGSLSAARQSYSRARELGRTGCSDGWGEFLATLLAPAPGPIVVRTPGRELVDRGQVQPIAPPGPIEVGPPDLTLPFSCEDESVLRFPALTPPEIQWPDV
jgi:hypothetical protein